MESGVVLLLLITITTAASAAAVKEHCHADDKRALLAIVKSFDNGTQFPSWEASTDCCRFWYGVKCDANNRVNRLLMVGPPKGVPDTLTGSIPEAVGDLSALVELRFHKNLHLTGSIPSSVARLQKLTSADFSWNALSGPIPTFFRHMTSLIYLALSYNAFSGSIPPELALGPAIASIDLSRNMLTGPIPAEFGSLKAAGIYLLLSHNRLTGEIPTSLEKVQFSNIDLSRNNFIGDASPIFSNGSDLWHVDLSRNRFSFNFSNVDLSSGAATLYYLDLSHNQIFGGIPATLSDVPNLELFNVSYNRLCGQIPAIGTYRSPLHYLHNKCLCGTPLPACSHSH